MITPPLSSKQKFIIYAQSYGVDREAAERIIEICVQMQSVNPYAGDPYLLLDALLGKFFMATSSGTEDKA